MERMNNKKVSDGIIKLPENAMEKITGGSAMYVCAYDRKTGKLVQVYGPYSDSYHASLVARELASRGLKCSVTYDAPKS